MCRSIPYGCFAPHAESPKTTIRIVPVHRDGLRPVSHGTKAKNVQTYRDRTGDAPKGDGNVDEGPQTEAHRISRIVTRKGTMTRTENTSVEA